MEDLRMMAEKTKAIRRCPVHDHVLLQGHAEAMGFAFFFTGRDEWLREQLREIIRAAATTCPECERLDQR